VFHDVESEYLRQFYQEMSAPGFIRQFYNAEGIFAICFMTPREYLRQVS
jgi:hypothetical protein